MKRKIMDDLRTWKKRSSGKCLLIQGARQVGKTYIVREFGREYDQYIEINFQEHPEFKEIFQGSLSAADLVRSIQLYLPGTQIVKGNTLLLLDEIQDCPEAVTALKFLAQDERLNVIATGSATGIVFRNQGAFPVGYVDFLQMNGMDFEEFLWALGVDESVTDDLRQICRERRKVPDAIHSRMNQYLRQYMVVGGMPETVREYVKETDYGAADYVQRQLLQGYIADIARYAEPGERIKAEACYRSIPRQLSKENHKFQYSVVEKGGSARKFESSLDWLSASQMIIPVNNVTSPEYPLQSFAVPDQVRVYYNDIGFLMASYGMEMKRALLSDMSVENVPENLVLRTAKGGMYEALAAEMLWKAGRNSLYFYRNEQGTVEMEFLIEGDDGVIPLEIKAGRNRTKSLNKLLESDKIAYGYKFSSQNAGVSGKKITMPLYMLPFAAER